MMASPSSPTSIPRLWEMNETSSRYEWMIAAPADKTMRIQWIAWAVLSWTVSAIIIFLFAAILMNKRARTNPFNGYLLFLMLPDMLFSVACAISCTMNAEVGHYFSAGMCQWQGWYLAFGAVANAWLNGVIAYQLLVLLRSSHIRQRYRVPTYGDVIQQVTAVYLWASFVATWPFLRQLGIPNFPSKISAAKGVGCIPLEYDFPSTLFFYLVYLPSASLIPCFYTIWVCVVVYRHNLLPPRGKRRMFAIYFFRIVAVYVYMWLPFYILTFISGNWTSTWSVWTGASFGHLQGFFSSVVSLMKPDIAEAARNLVKCQCSPTDDDYYDDEDGCDHVDAAIPLEVQAAHYAGRRRNSILSFMTAASSFRSSRLLFNNNNNNNNTSNKKIQQQPRNSNSCNCSGNNNRRSRGRSGVSSSRGAAVSSIYENDIPHQCPDSYKFDDEDSDQEEEDSEEDCTLCREVRDDHSSGGDQAEAETITVETESCDKLQTADEDNNTPPSHKEEEITKKSSQTQQQQQQKESLSRTQSVLEEEDRDLAAETNNCVNKTHDIETG